MIHQRFSDSEISLQQFNDHDTWWHIALMKSLEMKVPPENPVLAGTRVTGYHYFTDLTWVGIHTLTKIPVEIIYVFISPLFLSFLFISSTLLVSEMISKDWKIRLLTSALAVWGSGGAWYALFVFTNARMVDSMFWLDQPMQYGINHQLILSLAVGNVLLWSIFVHKKIPWWLGGILLGSLAGIKVYAFLIYFPVIFTIGLGRGIYSKKLELIKMSLVSILLAGIILLINKSALGFPFIWSPGWFVKTMFESGNHLNFPTWEIHRQLFTQTRNFPRLLFHWTWATGLFLLGNFGIKIASLLFLPIIFLTKKSKKTLYSTKVLVLFLLILPSIIFPMLFIQKGVVWNTIQFMHFAQIPLSFLFVILTQRFLKSTRVLTSILLIVLFFSLPTTQMTISQNLSKANYVHYDKQTIQTLLSIASVPDSTQIFVSAELDDSSIVPALGGKPVVWADPTVLIILGVIDEERLFTEKYLESQDSLCLDSKIQIHEIDEGKIFVQDCRPGS